MAADPRAQDAVDLFVDACVTDVLRLPPRVVDPSRIRSHELAEDAASQVEGRKHGTPVHEFSFKGSRVKLLTSKGEDGACVVRVSRADEGDMQSAFLEAVERIAAGSGAAIEPASVEVQGDPGTTVTTRSWRLPSKRGVLILAISTSPAHIGAQHCMTASYPAQGASPTGTPRRTPDICPYRE